MDYVPQNKHQWIAFLIWWLMMHLADFSLGKTEKIKANNVVELIIFGAIKLVSVFKRRK